MRRADTSGENSAQAATAFLGEAKRAEGEDRGQGVQGAVDVQDVGAVLLGAEVRP
jgi:hypothetical protein